MKQVVRRPMPANWSWIPRQFGQVVLGGVAILLAALVPRQAGAAPQKQPNFLWIVSEDNDPFLGCYGDKFANTPHLDKLAREGVLYLNAFANAPVCAPSRSTLLTGMYASTLGSQHMRSRYRIPADFHPYCSYLEDAGYYCMNPGKTDYNIAGDDKAVWNKGRSWKDAPPGKPWMLVLNSMITHESALHGSVVHPEYLKEPFTLPPYHPDTPEIRSNWVEYYHDMTKMDAWAGALVDQLEKDGLADDTIIFYYSDHGGILPRSKRFVYDSGLHVPLIIRFGKHFQDVAPAAPGSKLDRVVSFVDFAPSLLSLAGADIPPQYQGLAFLGPKMTQAREYAFGFRGRMDERYDLSYSVRDKRYRYIRNFMPHRIYGQHLAYLWKMPAAVSWEHAYQLGACDADQSAFWKQKPSEELYDESLDPYEVKNLAESSPHQAVLEEMRKVLREQMLANRDSGLLPESEMIARAKGDPVYTMTHDPARYPMQRVLDTAELATRRDLESVPKLIELMKDPDPAVRYWAAAGSCIRANGARDATEPLLLLLKDGTPCVRIAAAEALCHLDHSAEGLATLVHELDGGEFDTLLALNSLEALGQIARPAADTIAEKVAHLAKAAGEDYCAHAAESLLNELGTATTTHK